MPSAGDPQTLNRYSYVRNNPLIYTDPSGEVFWLIPALIGAAIGGAIGGTISALTGGSFWRGFLAGAVAGFGLGWGIAGVGPWLSSTFGIGARLAASIGGAIGGAAGGAAASAIQGGNVGLGALIGGVTGAIFGYLDPVNDVPEAVRSPAGEEVRQLEPVVVTVPRFELSLTPGQASALSAATATTFLSVNPRPERPPEYVNSPLRLHPSQYDALLIGSFGIEPGSPIAEELAFDNAGNILFSGAGGKVAKTLTVNAAKQAARREGFELSEHALLRMGQRGISPHQMAEALRSGVSLRYFHEGVWKVGYYDAQTRVFVGTHGRVITTVIGNVRPQYIRNLMAAVPP